MDSVRDATEAASTVGTELRTGEGEAASRVRGSHAFTREQHQALAALTFGDFELRPLGYRTIAGTYVRMECVETLLRLGLVTLGRVRQNPGNFHITAAISKRGRMVAEQLGPPGVFPLRELAKPGLKPFAAASANNAAARPGARRG